MKMKRILSVLIIVLAMFASAQTVFAQDTQPAGPALVPAAPAEAPTADGQYPEASEGEVTTQPSQEKPSMKPIFIMVAVMILLFWFMNRGKKKQQQKRQELLSSIKKGDKVTTIGGIVGTIVEVRDNEVMLKVNDNNDIRMKFARWAIRGVGEDAKNTDPETEKK